MQNAVYLFKLVYAKCLLLPLPLNHQWGLLKMMMKWSGNQIDLRYQSPYETHTLVWFHIPPTFSWFQGCNYCKTYILKSQFYRARPESQLEVNLDCHTQELLKISLETNHNQVPDCRIGYIIWEGIHIPNQIFLMIKC